MTGESKFSGLEGPERLIGSRVLEFELTAVLGAGGMSVVYRARHRLTGQEVAIKILPPELATHDELKARFVEEARVLALLDHPNIVHLNNFCESGGRLCLVMQFVEGRTFEQAIVANRRVEPYEVARIGIEVLKGLAYAHAQNVVHRDIKPSNILVRPDGHVKVTDFGIAKLLGTSRLTSTGQTMGTVRYMSPEQVRGKLVDARSDVYSLGVTMFEGLAGRTPFEGENHFEIMQQHLNKRPPPLAQLGAVVPPALEKVLLRALEKKPEDRYQTAEDMQRALEAELPALRTATPSRVVRAHKRAASLRALALGLGATVAVAGAGGTAYLLLERRSSEPAQPVTPAEPPAAPRRFDPHVLPSVVISVDETYEADGLRVQSSRRRDPLALRAQYASIKRALKDFMAASDEPALREAAGREAPALTLVVVPQAVLDQPALWPGFDVKPGTSYESRYVPTRATLFVADSAELRELPYGVAVHVFARLRALPNDRLVIYAEKFEAYYRSTRP